MPETKQFYYFTSTKYALEAVKDRQLKAAELDKTNDPYELFGFRLDSLISNEHKISNEEKLALAEEMADDFKNDVSKIMKMVCLSKTYKEPSLWGHYADRCKGVCLGFDINVYGDPEKDIIEEVNYGKDREGLNYFGWYLSDGRFRPPKEFQNNNIFYYKSIGCKSEIERF